MRAAASTDDDRARIARLVRVYRRAARVLGNRVSAERWLQSALPELGGRTPLRTALTDQGATLIESILVRIARGDTL